MCSHTSLELGGESESARHFQRHWENFQLHFNAQLKGSTSESAVLYFPSPVFPGKAMTSSNHRVHHSYIQMKKKEPEKVLSSMETVIYPHSFPLKNQNIVIAQGVSTHNYYLFLSHSNIRKQFLSYIHTYTQKLQICVWLELNFQIESEGKWVWLHKFYCFSVKVINMHYSFINKWFKVCSAYKSQVEAVL